MNKIITLVKIILDIAAILLVCYSDSSLVVTVLAVLIALDAVHLIRQLNDKK